MFNRLTAPILYFILALLMVGCQSVSDLQPQPNPLPTSVVEILETEFPGYKEITVIPLEKDKIWSARLHVDTSRYDLVLNRTKILSRFKLVANSVPATVVEKISSTILKGGTFSEYEQRQRKSNEFPDREYSARYVWNNADFFATWTSLIPMSGRLDFYPEVEVSYLTEQMDDLPEDIQNTIQRKINEAKTDPKTPRHLDFWNARVYNYRNKKKSYEISFGVTKLEIGQDGQVIFWDFDEGFNNGFDVILNREEVPQEINDFLDSDPVAPTFTKFQAIRFRDSGTARYRVILSGSRLLSLLYFDDKNTLVRQYYQYYF
jgi:hypothetical protein